MKRESTKIIVDTRITDKMPGLNDGWDDESDLNNISQDDTFNFDGDGWGDDDDIDLGDDDEVPPITAPVQQVPPIMGQFSAANNDRATVPSRFGNDDPAAASLGQPAVAAYRSNEALDPGADDNGWGDDDLNFDDDSTPVDAAIPSNHIDNNGQTGDGWGDDDFGFDEETPSTSELAGKPAQGQIEAGGNAGIEGDEDGWGDELDFDDDFEDKVENEKVASSSFNLPTQPRQNSIPPPPIKKKAAIPPPPKRPAILPPPKQTIIAPISSNAQEDGWSESNNSESDLLEFDDGFGNVPVPTANVAAGNKQVPSPSEQDGWEDDADVVADSKGPNKSFESGWGDDDDLFLDETSEMPNFPPQRPVANPRREELLRDLKGYVGSLNRMLSSVNAVLEYEYNTPQKAMELTEYYQTRANLAEYTRTKELSRMDYRVVLPNGDVVLDKQEIAANFMPDQSLAARCANQSLLADLLQVITDKDLLVRPQFMAICIAHDCKFTIHSRDETVEAAAQLHIALPQADGQRANIANIFATIAFIPQQPMVHFRVNAIDVLLPEHDFDKVLSSSVDFLMECQMDAFDLDGSHATPADVYRDAFMENSQKLLAQSTMGMKSALREMESVLNFKQKLTIVKRFIPDTDALLAAEQEAMEFAANRRIEQQNMPHPGSDQPGPTPPHIGSHEPRPPPPPPRRQPQLPGSRPQSILGGLVRSGLNKLANSVTLPDDDPAIYGQAAPVVPPVYRQDGSPFTHQGNQAQTNLLRGFPRPPSDAPPVHKSLQSHGTTSAQNPPASLSGRQQGGRQSEQLDLSRGFPRPIRQANSEPKKAPPPPPPPGRISEVDLSKGFPRPPPCPPPQQPKKAETEEVDLLKGFPRPSKPLSDQKVLGSGAVDLSKGFPRPQPPPPPSRPNQNQSSVAFGIVEDGWEDGSLDDDISNTSREHGKPTPNSESKESPLLTSRDYFAFDATNYVYDPETDIIPTIKRWKNLRPHRPYVVW
ncbi:unnamed protein product [Cylindrotheca closterium]|uniref:Uncharacterized protein n=1 Tax=Cylindrotheca closterium TaxID=2856 RepID=A0AAD2JNK0_9STRA|nr:unnamed protein product [Cylindrotheca closterium]